jgi:hypothetical protein
MTLREDLIAGGFDVRTYGSRPSTRGSKADGSRNIVFDFEGGAGVSSHPGSAL